MWLRKMPQLDTGLIAKANEHGTGHHWHDFEEIELVCLTEAGKEETHWKVCLPNEALKLAIH